MSVLFVFCNTLRAIISEQFIFPQKFHCVAQRIAGSSADQAAPDRVKINLCLLYFAHDMLHFFRIIFPVKITEIPAELSEIVLIFRMIQNSKINSSEKVPRFHAIVIKLP